MQATTSSRPVARSNSTKKYISVAITCLGPKKVSLTAMTTFLLVDDLWGVRGAFNI